jgi:hypothetical protein
MVVAGSSPVVGSYEHSCVNKIRGSRQKGNYCGKLSDYQLFNFSAWWTPFAHQNAYYCMHDPISRHFRRAQVQLCVVDDCACSIS